METLIFNDQELKVRARESRRLERLCRGQGEKEAADHYAAVLRALEAEGVARGLTV